MNQFNHHATDYSRILENIIKVIDVHFPSEMPTSLKDVEDKDLHILVGRKQIVEFLSKVNKNPKIIEQTLKALQEK